MTVNGNHERKANGRSAVTTLRQFIRSSDETAEHCELCAKALDPAHPHLLEIERRRAVCACEACAILFDGSTRGNARQRFRRIPRDVRLLTDFQMDDAEWASLLVPINLAYFVHSTQAGRVLALYPNPGGVMESALDLEYWNAILARNPVLQTFEPDVEALLVHRLSARPLYFRAPIDQCFRLTGILRNGWRGLSGGHEVWQQIENFFRQLLEASGADPNLIVGGLAASLTHELPPHESREVRRA